MKAKLIHLALPAAALLAVVPGSAARFNGDADHKAAAPQATSSDQVYLDKGMAADAITAKLGKPERVEKLKPETANAEKWTYRQLVGHRVTQEATGATQEPAFIGTGGQGANDLGSRTVLTYQTKDIETYRVTALLMVNGKLELAKQWLEEKVRYN